MTAFTRYGSMVCLVLASSLTMLAHHPFSSEYDAKKPLTMTGLVSKVEWQGPHGRIFMNVKNESGATEEWQLETASPDFLAKHGVKKSAFPKGAVITVHGYRSSDKSKMASARVINVAGKNLIVCDTKEDGGPGK